MNNLPWLLKVALVEEIKLIPLEGVADIYSFPRPRADNVNFPCVQVTSAGEAEEFDSGSTTESLATDWGFRVYLCERAGVGESGDIEADFFGRRKALIDHFRLYYGGFLASLRSRGLPVKRVRVRALPQIDEVLAALPEYQILAGGIVVRIQASEARG